MDQEVDPQVLAVINEKRLSGPRLNPVEIVEKMGVLAARERPFDHAWLASGDGVIATIWGEHVMVGTGARWFSLELLDTQFRTGGRARSPNQVQRAKDRLVLLKRTFDSQQTFRAVLQTNRVPIDELESNKSAKVSTRVRDDEEWHVAAWEPDEGLAVLVRGARGWVPSGAEVQAARARRGVPDAPKAGTADSTPVSGEDVQAAALAYVTRHFSGYGYKAKDVSSQHLGYDIEVSSPKGETLLKVAVKGTSLAAPRLELSSDERACSAREKLWRLLVVSDPLGSAAQHRIYKATEVSQAPGFEGE
ncbi:hypothetical protein GCM10027034_13190 [Ramlibacter solisilvae]|uniref:Protein NO VEIN C-terminal domain-containing protein n=1 Tax=Ramlibacter tataouinensis TaxID=94132 RepID=A0A127JWM7_9BURK|nr:DUF3883 domain-containing protein [Ramlibacter tataouinensis]AMO24418.1 hypothetical protein UC35_18215 [Ramlibacter tataouinensis]